MLGFLVDGAPAASFELRYKGALGPRRSRLKAPVKQFQLYCLADRKASTLDFVVEEQGPGQWPWPERFGRVKLDPQGQPVGATRIRVLYNHEGLLYPQTLQQPIFEYVGKLKAGNSWEQGRTRYAVTGEQKKLDRPCWRVEMKGANGPLGTVWVERDTGIVVALSRRVIMGQGDEFVLSLELASLNGIEGSQLAAVKKPLMRLLQVQQQLKRKPQQTRPELSTAQIAVVQKAILQLKKDSESTPLAQLTQAIVADVRGQSKRVSSVDGLAAQFVGKPAPPFRLATINRKTVDSKSLAGKIVVLHFWSYKGDKLVEPYGQVGYLDFLHGKRRRLGVEVIGVAVNPALGNPQQSRAAVRSIKKLREFMNLDYTVATDPGKVLATFGDPRKIDAKLPLWVVIDADGKVVHYKVGFYRIKADEGLRQLDELLIRLIRQRRKKQDKKSG